jgi:prophage regulatory protein
MEEHKPGRLMTVKAVAELTTLSVPTIWRFVRRGQFPKPITLGPNRRAWTAQAVTDWISKCESQDD